MSNDNWSSTGDGSPENTSSNSPVMPGSGSSEPSSPQTPVSHSPRWSSSWEDLGSQTSSAESGSTGAAEGSSDQPKIIRHVPASPDFEQDTATQIANKPWGQTPPTPGMGATASTGQQPGYGGQQSSWGSWNQQPTSQQPASQQPTSQASASQPRGWENTGWTPNSGPSNAGPGNAGPANAGPHQPNPQGWEQTASMPSPWQSQQPQQPQQPQKPKNPDAGMGGFLRNLFDFSFTRYVSPSIVKVLYILSIIGVVLYWLGSIVWTFAMGTTTHMVMHPDGTIGTSRNHGAIALAIADVVLGWIPALLAIALIRMQYEYIIALIRTSEYARDIKAKLDAPSDK